MRATDLGTGRSLAGAEFVLAWEIEPTGKKGNHTRLLQPSAIEGERQRQGWEDPLKAIVIQWKVFGGLEVITN
jgi:hypothetical protein